MPNTFTTDHHSQLTDLLVTERILCEALIPLFAARYREWLSTMTPDAFVGQVPISRFLELPPEEVGARVLRRVLLSCAECYPKPIPTRGVCVYTGLDVVETTDDTVEFLEELGVKLIEILIESTELVAVEEQDNGRHTLRMHPVWGRRVFTTSRVKLTIAR
ncbi:hypothetical protein SAMN05216198_2991 [Halopseudomonas litoralis]|uniref:Uncharacterized protein n=1 Tax=Halopseudomonas litoralis TaxID=797277 RepID=A0A1H1VNT6_9GAMM|nr:hypothetical protein [Halopseudomonas litoralis]SDS86482.1 hypothetical protein SAMN05216198_2991 [Halopseudomonas litoralis]